MLGRHALFSDAPQRALLVVSLVEPAVHAGGCSWTLGWLLAVKGMAMVALAAQGAARSLLAPARDALAAARAVLEDAEERAAARMCGDVLGALS